MARLPRGGRAFLSSFLLAALAVAGCSSSGPKAPTVGAAKTFELAGFRPQTPVRPGVPVRVSFRISQPSGQVLTQYRTGAGPHTGVHLIIVRSDLALIVHRHPPIAADGTARDTIVLPAPGRYRVLVDAYPALKNVPRNFQLHASLVVAGPFRSRPLPPFSRTLVVDGYRFVYHGSPRVRALTPTFAQITVTRPDGSPARPTVWFGAFAHAIFFRAGSLDYFHTHVCGQNTPSCSTATGGAPISGRAGPRGSLSVGILLLRPGTWRMFLQCKVDGRILTAPFTLTAR